MTENPLLRLATFGQSLWLDYIRRHLINSGDLRQLIEEDGLTGITSNPAIFEKAIAHSNDYDDAIRQLALENKNAAEIFEALTVADVQQAADVFLPLYKNLQGKDGYVSLEVNPHLARDTNGTIAEARRLWKLVGRPNLLIKVPATKEGLPVIRQLISEGININVTLLFGLPRYEEVAEAYLAGLEDRLEQDKPLKKIASVASFFLSRIDGLVDARLEKIMAAGGPKALGAKNLRGAVAIASAKLAYSIYQRIFRGQRFQKLAAHGAETQRLLWASTSTKNPAYSDVKYVEALIGPDTITTLPIETLNAYRNHGNPEERLRIGLDYAAGVLQWLPELEIDLNQISRELEDEGIEKFNLPFDSLMCSLEEKRLAALAGLVDAQTFQLGDYQNSVTECLNHLEKEKFHQRLWRKDPSLWQSDKAAQQQIQHALGWLHVPEKMAPSVISFVSFAQEMRQEGFRQAVLLGMGGSSLTSLTLQKIYPPGSFGLPLAVLDTTAPDTIKEIEQQINIAQTLFIVASKSGTTAEPRALADYFYDRLKTLKGEQAGKNFVAITDFGSPLEKMGEDRSFRRVFCNFPDIGGRYSALSCYGMLPAAVMDLKVKEFLDQSLRMLDACAACVPLKQNPGIILGAALGELARQGRNKVTFLIPPRIFPLSLWLEQLLAESTGKDGTGLLPVTGEPIGAASVYDDDRIFVYIYLQREEDRKLAQGVEALSRAGHPVATIRLEQPLALAQEFFRWEIAIATAGAVLGLNPFNQPNVQESKETINRLLHEIQEKDKLPEAAADRTEPPVSLYGLKEGGSIAAALAGFWSRANRGDYIALLAYLPENAELSHVLNNVRVRLRDTLKVATTLGYGPRYLHSTGQFHKGGPNTGLFLILTAAPQEDLPIPGKPYTFGIFQKAQALGDLETLQRHGRRVVRLDLGDDLQKGLRAFEEMIAKSLS